MTDTTEAAYLEYYNKLILRLPSYPDTFRTHLSTIMGRIDKLDFLPAKNWEHECGIDIQDSMSIILSNIKQDIIAWNDLEQHTLAFPSKETSPRTKI